MLFSPKSQAVKEELLFSLNVFNRLIYKLFVSKFGMGGGFHR